jgi:hypothetical protein
MHDPEIEERYAAIHRTLVESLFHSGHADLAGAILEGDVDTESRKPQQETYFVEIPPAAYRLVAESEEIQSVLRKAMSLQSDHALT